MIILNREESDQTIAQIIFIYSGNGHDESDEDFNEQVTINH